jgi:hypothetical protein
MIRPREDEADSDSGEWEMMYIANNPDGARISLALPQQLVYS